MSVETPSLFAQAIQNHLELKHQNAALERSMPLDGYKSEDPFDNHPLFKTEEQARIEDTMDGAQSIVDEPTSVEWPAASAVFEDEPSVTVTRDEESEAVSDETLWTRSRDFDWGD